MTCREPRLSALLADAQGRLSPAGRRRWQAHRQRCTVCNAAAAGRAARVLHGLTETAREAPAPTLDWERIAPALQLEARRMQRRRRLQRATPLLVALAAAAALGYVALRPAQTSAPPQVAHSLRSRVGEPATQARAAPAVAPTARPAEPALLPAVHWTLARMAEPPASTPLQEGVVLATGPGEALHVQLEPGTGFVLEASSRLRLARLRAGEVELELQAGAVTSRVRKLGAGERYEVLAGAERVRVRGTRFRVARGEHGSEVSIDEGVVEVVSLRGAVLAELRAPDRWPASEAPLGALSDPHGYLLPVVDWPRLRVPALPGARWLQVGETRVTGPGALALRVPAGDVELRAELADGRRLGTRLRAEGAALEVDATRLRVVGSAPRRATPAPLPPSVLASVLHRSTPALQRCYERSLLLQPTLEGRFRLGVTLDAAGRVAATQVDGAGPVPPELTRCVAEVTARWQFPAAAAGAELEAPLNLSRARP